MMLRWLWEKACVVVFGDSLKSDECQLVKKLFLLISEGRDQDAIRLCWTIGRGRPVLAVYNQDGYNLLHFAILYQRSAIIKTLIERFLECTLLDRLLFAKLTGRQLADIEEAGSDCVHLAVAIENESIVATLLQANYFDFEKVTTHLAKRVAMFIDDEKKIANLKKFHSLTPLEIAITIDNTAILTLLLDRSLLSKGAAFQNKLAANLLDVSLTAGSHRSMEALLHRFPRVTIDDHLQRAVELQDWRAFRLLIDRHEARTDANGNSLLHLVAKPLRIESSEEFMDTVRHLVLNKGVDINARNVDGMTALDLFVAQTIRACVLTERWKPSPLRSWPETVRMLLELGATSDYMTVYQFIVSFCDHFDRLHDLGMPRHVRIDFALASELLQWLCAGTVHELRPSPSNFIEVLFRRIPLLLACAAYDWNEDILLAFAAQVCACVRRIHLSMGTIAYLLSHCLNRGAFMEGPSSPTLAQYRVRSFEFIRSILLLLISHGLDLNQTNFSRRDCKTVESENALQMIVFLARNARQLPDLERVRELSKLLLLHGAEPDLEPFPAEPVIVHSQSSIYLQHRCNFVLAQLCLIIPDGIPFEHWADLLRLLANAMSHESLQRCVRSVLRELAINVGRQRALQEALSTFLDDLVSRPPSLRHICRLAIHKSLRRRVAANTAQIGLPSSLQRYVTNLEG